MKLSKAVKKLYGKLIVCKTEVGEEIRGFVMRPEEVKGIYSAFHPHLFDATKGQGLYLMVSPVKLSFVSYEDVSSIDVVL